jgi:hypothetical protein
VVRDGDVVALVEEHEVPELLVEEEAAHEERGIRLALAQPLVAVRLVLGQEAQHALVDDRVQRVQLVAHQRVVEVEAQPRALAQAEAAVPRLRRHDA